MSDIEKAVKDYLEKFIACFSHFLKNSIAFNVTVYPYNNGVIFKLQFVDNEENKSTFIEEKVHSLKAALEVANIKLAGYKNEQMEDPEFSISNIILNENSIFIFKKYVLTELSEAKANNDVKKIVNVLV